MFEFYKKYSSKIVDTEVYEIKCFQTKNHIADLYVAEYDNQIICLWIMEKIVEQTVKYDNFIYTSPGHDFSIIQNEKYKYTNVVHLMCEYISNTTNTIILELYSFFGNKNLIGTAFIKKDS